jgi:hypothetical protein
MTQYLCKHMGRPLWEKQADKNSNQVIDLIDVFFLVLFYANCDLNYYFIFYLAGLISKQKTKHYGLTPLRNSQVNVST